MLITRIWDGINDPNDGTIADQHKKREMGPVQTMAFIYGSGYCNLFGTELQLT